MTFKPGLDHVFHLDDQFENAAKVWWSPCLPVAHACHSEHDRSRQYRTSCPVHPVHVKIQTLPYHLYRGTWKKLGGK